MRQDGYCNSMWAARKINAKVYLVDTLDELKQLASEVGYPLFAVIYGEEEYEDDGYDGVYTYAYEKTLLTVTDIEEIVGFESCRVSQENPEFPGATQMATVLMENQIFHVVLKIVPVDGMVPVTNLIDGQWHGYARGYLLDGTPVRTSAAYGGGRLSTIGYTAYVVDGHWVTIQHAVGSTEMVELRDVPNGYVEYEDTVWGGTFFAASDWYEEKE